MTPYSLADFYLHFEGSVFLQMSAKFYQTTWGHISEGSIFQEKMPLGADAMIDTIKRSTSFWVVKPCRSGKDRCFEGNIFFRNAGLSSNCTTLQPRRFQIQHTYRNFENPAFRMLLLLNLYELFWAIIELTFTIMKFGTNRVECSMYVLAFS
jgi:hypothetical protein